MYSLPKRDRIDYNRASIPSKFKMESKELFDKKYMNALFTVAYEQGRTATDGQRLLPDFDWIKQELLTAPSNGS